MLWINRASGISDFDGSRVVLTAFRASVSGNSNNSKA